MKKRDLLEGVGLAALIGGLVPALWLGTARIPLIALFGLLYFYHLRAYRRTGRLGVFLRFHLLEIFLLPAAGLGAGILSYVLIMFSMAGRDYGVPMVAGFIFGILFLLLFPPLLVGMHLPLLILARKFVLRRIRLAEAWRLTLLSLGLGLISFSLIRGGLSSLLLSPPSSPEILPGPEVSFHPFLLSDNRTIYYTLLNPDFLHGREVLSARLIEPEEASPERKTGFLHKEVLRGHLLFYSLGPIEIHPGQTRLRLETMEHIAFLGDRPGPFYDLPVKSVAPLPPFGLRAIRWEREPEPGLVLELESHFPLEFYRVCFNFAGSLRLRAGHLPNYRDLRLKARGAHYLRRGEKEYYCYEPLEIPKPPVFGPFTVRFPMPREDFEALTQRGLVGTGRGPIPTRVLVQGMGYSVGVFGGQPLERAFEITLPFPGKTP